MAGVTHDCHDVAKRFAQRSRKLSPVVYGELLTQAQFGSGELRAKRR